MNAKQLIAGLVVLAAAGSAFAEVPYPPETQFVSTKTRADVQAELVQARAQGLMNINDANYPVLASAPATQIRQADGKPVTLAGSSLDNFNAELYRGA